MHPGTVQLTIGNYPAQARLLVKRLLLSYLLYTFSRLIFHASNYSLFQSTEGRLLADLWHGLRFDSFTIVSSNSLFIVLSILPIRVFYKPWYQRVLKVLFLSVNLIFIAFNFVDAGYFPFTRKRSTADLLLQLGGQSDLAALLPAIVADFWWLILLFAALVVVTVRLYPRLKTNEMATKEKAVPAFLRTGLFILLIVSLSVLALRGGLQPAPIDIVDAGAATSAGRESIVLNTPFTIIKSLDKKALKEYNFYSGEEVDALWPTIHHYPGATSTRQNLVVIVLESFSKGYTSLGRGKSFTPFLDSLMQRSTVFTNAYANSSKSIEGLPAILSSLPSYMDNPFINSRYVNNRQTSLATLLSGEGYQTAFFHGGKNGTMNFTEWARLAGYDKYYGMNEYGNDDDYDGFWGIYDEPFLQYCARELDKLERPFHAAIFTLSSHHPYAIPKKYRSAFSDAGSDVGAALRYADHSLKEFFESIGKLSWYNNTLFVLVADHAAISSELFIPDPLGNLRIPILIFDPSQPLRRTYPHVFGQADLLPEVMYRLGYNKPYFSLGKPAADTLGHFVCYYGDGRHQLITDSLYLSYSGTVLQDVRNYKRDSTLSKMNIAGAYQDVQNHVDRKYRALLQAYSHALIHDAASYKDN